MQHGLMTRDYVQDIVDECQNDWGRVTSHPFPQALAKGTAPLNGFRHYMIQDATYLEYYYRVRMEAVARSGSFQDITDFAAGLPSSLQYVKDVRSDCTKKLGVPADVVAGEGRSQALDNSINLYKDTVEKGDWLDIHIALLPCIMGYHFIASKLLSDPNTIRNTPYFPLWIQANASASSFKKYKGFINGRINNHCKNLTEHERDDKWKYWVQTFTKACETERNFFNLGISGFPLYEVKRNGTYKIRSYRSGNPYLVVSGTTVTTQADEPGDDGQWILENGDDGYFIKKGDQYLVPSIEGPIRSGFKAGVSEVEQRWSINAVPVSAPTGPYQAYQLLVSGFLQFVLDSGDSMDDLEVFVANNSEVSSQLWLLEPVA